MELNILLLLITNAIWAHPSRGVSLEEMQSLDVEVITEKLQDCKLIFLQIKTHIDYSSVTTPYLLNDYVKWNLGVVYTWEGVPFKVQNLHCNVMFALTGDELETSFPSEGGYYNPQTISISTFYISSYVRVQMKSAKTIPMLFLILHCDLVKNYLFDKIHETVRSEYLSVPTFVLTPGIAHNNLQTFSGYYICWFYTNCRVRFRCYGSECIDSMREIFDIATNFGKRLTWKHGLFEDHFKIEVGLTLGSPFRRKKPWILFKTMYHFLIEDFYNNRSVLPAKSNALQIGKSEARWSNRLIPLFYTSGFHFITSDGVQSRKLEIALYTNPMEMVVWIAVALATIFTSIVLASGTFTHWRPTRSWSTFLFSVFGYLMEQGSFVADSPSKIYRTKSNTDQSGEPNAANNIIALTQLHTSETSNEFLALKAQSLNSNYK
ncbi:unnamed protein product [Allacma fusca]|uniref:Uncharacterized protein n=1 Tax=Allacma fusca TaxID=39272 RepID=A0A8J2PIT6_9HEXA|nr:unnamed protein product [Allacma fusca]